MRRFLLAIIAIAAVCAAPARVTAQYVNSPPIFDWSGLYIGVVGSYGWGDPRHCGQGPCPDNSAVTPIRGALGGVNAGYNLQHNNWLAGIEGDMSWGKINGSANTNPTFNCFEECRTEVRWNGTLRGRLGFVADRLLPYVTAGVGVTGMEARLGTVAPIANGTANKTSFVWGGGVEFAVLPQWSAKVEFLRFEKSGNFVYDHVGKCTPPGPCYVTDTGYNLARVALTYQFGSDQGRLPANRQIVDWGPSPGPVRQAVDWGAPTPTTANAPRQAANWNLPPSTTSVVDTGEDPTPVPAADVNKLPVAVKPVAGEPTVISPPKPAMRGNGSLFD